MAKSLDTTLTKHGVEHQFVLTPGEGHTWRYWRENLANFLPQLFR